MMGLNNGNMDMGLRYWHTVPEWYLKPVPRSIAKGWLNIRARFKE